jgi:hypothetical protein
METIKLCEEDAVVFVQVLEEDWGDWDSDKAVELYKKIVKSKDDWLI